MKAFKNFVNGQHVEAGDGRTSAVVNPSTGEQYATAPVSGQADVDAAMAGATRRRVSGPWHCSASPMPSRPVLVNSSRSRWRTAASLPTS